VLKSAAGSNRVTIGGASLAAAVGLALLML
jgi:hypothetical protein